ncbi:MAG: glycosyltransferase [Candidatus Acidiferrales bacterium]
MSGGENISSGHNPWSIGNQARASVHILNVAQTYFPYAAEGGRPAKVRAISGKLAEHGHSVTVLTANLGMSEWLRVAHQPEETRMGLESTENGIVAIYLPTLARYRVLTINPRVIRFCRGLLAGFDLVHFYGLYDLLGPMVGYFCRREGIPYVIEPMGMYRPIDRAIRMKKIWHRTVGGAFWRNAAKIIATSELEQQELEEDGVAQAKIAIRYNGIDLSAKNTPRGEFRLKWGILADEPLILFLSRLIPRKGADVLIEAFAAACPEWGRLVIVGPEGEPGYQAQLEQCAQDCGVRARVLFTGPLYEEDKISVLADADVFALPSRYENFANVVAEAIACGVPVIITPFCGIRSLVDGRAGLVVNPEKKAFAAALEAMLHDRLLYARLKESCREVALQFSWDHLTDQMEGYYQEILARGRSVS